MKPELVRGISVAILGLGIAIGSSVPIHAAQTPPKDPAQEPTQGPPEPGAAEDDTPTLTMLRALQETIGDKRAALERLRERLGQTLDLEGQRVIREQAAALATEIRRLEGDFDALATGLDLVDFREDLHGSTDLREELESLLRPLIEELKEATKSPRQIEQLRRDLTRIEERQTLANRAVSRIQELEGENRDPALDEILDAKLIEWKAEQRQLENLRTITEFQLDHLLESRRSLIESSSDLVSTFFRSRGLHFFLALGAFIAVFAAFRGAHYVISRRRRGRTRSFYSRLVQALFFLTAFFAATLAVLVVLYAKGDWVLLGLMLIFLAGLAWAGRQVVPRFLDQGRLLLNIGPVRENERVVVDGVPFRVATLGLHSVFVNPMLSGGHLRRSLNSLLEMQSRPCARDEVWFPCREEDWVKLGDGTWGRVTYQGPEFVQIQCKGGASVTYRTADFLGMSPQNLSGGFRVKSTFGVDYRHQAISTTEIPARMRDALRERLADMIGAEHVLRISVEFASAGASSLDYAILADFAGDVAVRNDVLERAVQRILVDVCNEEGWVIPFTQVTLHQA